MVAIPAGTLEMCDDRTKETWKSTIAPFYLAKYPVQQWLYQSIMSENPSSFKGSDLPVESLSWLEAVSFCNRLSEQLGLQAVYVQDPETAEMKINSEANGYRLPSEAEWQFACMAGSTDIRYGELNDIAWYKGNSGGKTQVPGLKKANDWGLHDMLGNVWEWYADIYDETVYGSYRIFRGGGWCDEERSVMATTRRRSHPKSFRIDDLGFRIARNAIN